MLDLNILFLLQVSFFFWQVITSSVFTWQNKTGNTEDMQKPACYLWRTVCTKFHQCTQEGKYNSVEMSFWQTGLVIEGDPSVDSTPLRASGGSRLCNALTMGNIPFPSCLEHSQADWVTFSYVIQSIFTVPKYFASFSQSDYFTSYLWWQYNKQVEVQIFDECCNHYLLEWWME